jgi:dinuclear metal center YbgI/SA1388 family protein
MSVSLDRICQALSRVAPLKLAESWDNVGLLVGDRAQSISKVMTCLTVTPTVAEEAIQADAGLVVTHHPIPFRPLGRITCDTTTGQILWRLIGAGVGVYSAHTAFDSAADGINQTWAEALKLTSIEPINDPTPENELGSGRRGVLPNSMTAREVIRRCSKMVSTSASPRGVGPLDRVVRQVGFACGSGGSFLTKAHGCGCELLITGEATFHDCLQAESFSMAMGLLGHYHSERFAMERLAEQLQREFPELSVWPSANEADPIQMV